MDLERRNTFKIFLRDLEIDGQVYKFYDVSQLNEEKYARLPYSIRVILEAAVRNCDELQVTSRDVKNLLNWPDTQKNEVEVPFIPSRVLLQDFTGVPALIDFAALRNTIDDLNANPARFNPCCPVDLVLDQSLQVDFSKRLLLNNNNGGVLTPASSSNNLNQIGERSKMCPSPTPSQSSANCRCISNGIRPLPQQQQQLKRVQTHPPQTHLSKQAARFNQGPAINNTTVSSSTTSLNGDSNNSNSQYIQIDVGYKECPFHYIRTECAESIEKSLDLEFERNQERFKFLKWSSQTMKNMSIVPPGNGISHQINLEHLSRVVHIEKRTTRLSSSVNSTPNQSDDDEKTASIPVKIEEYSLIFPDSLVGTDSHSTQVNGSGVLGWTVGGIEAEAAMLGLSTRIILPRVVGYRLVGTLNDLCTSTDLVIAITKNLRQIGVVNKFVEFFGPGVAQLSMADRQTIANMCPEYGALVAYFPFDNKAAQYLLKTGHDEKTVKIISEYMKSVQLFKEYSESSENQVTYSEVHELDLASIIPCVSGPKRSIDKIALADFKSEFRKSLTAELGFNGFGMSEENSNKKVNITYDNKKYTLENGSVVMATITSCTNSSNPSVMLAAALLAKKAVDFGLSVKPYIKTSISPGSGLVIEYLNKSGMIPCLESLGFKIVGYGCTKCIENSTNIPDKTVLDAIEKNDLIAVGVLSGNRNFEGRIHPSTRASYLASPPLVIAYALAGRVDIDFENEPIGFSQFASTPVFLRDIWPRRAELQELEMNWIVPQIYFKTLDRINIGCKQWEVLDSPESYLYPWDYSSTYIKKSPFLDAMNMPSDIITRQIEPIKNAHVLVYVGDSITTDHISPAGSIARNSPAARYLSECGLAPRDFNSYGSRRGNDAVMSRGTFANLRLVNKLLPLAQQQQPKTLVFPSGREMDIYDASEVYKRDRVPLIVIAGKEYGSGSPRDWAVKGPWMLGIKSIIAESFEKSHRSNLISMGVLPLQFLDGESPDKLKLTGREKYTIHLDEDLRPQQHVNVETDNGIKFNVICRIDSSIELEYYRNGGILKYAIRNFMQE